MVRIKLEEKTRGKQFVYRFTSISADGIVA